MNTKDPNTDNINTNNLNVNDEKKLLNKYYDLYLDFKNKIKSFNDKLLNLITQHEYKDDELTLYNLGLQFKELNKKINSDIIDITEPNNIDKIRAHNLYTHTDEEIIEIIELEKKAYRDYKKILKKEYDNMRILFYNKYIENPDIADQVYTDIIGIRYYKYNEGVDNFYFKNYFILTSFTEFQNIKNVIVNNKTLKILSYLEKYEDIDHIEDIRLKYQNYIKNNEYKTNAKNIFIFEKFLRERGFHLDFLNENNYIEILNLDKHYINNIANTGINTLIILNKDRDNVNLEFVINITSNKIFKIRILSLNNLIAETRFKLYAENFEETEVFLKYIEHINSLDEFTKKMRFAYNTRNLSVQDRALSLSIKDKRKNFFDINNLYKNSYFLFKGFNWNEVVSEFRKNKIIISGGMNNKKNLLSTMDFKLILFLQKGLGIDNDNLIYKIIKNSHSTKYGRTNITKETIEKILPFSFPEKINTYNILLNSLMSNNKEKEDVQVNKNYIDLSSNDNKISDKESLSTNNLNSLIKSKTSKNNLSIKNISLLNNLESIKNKKYHTYNNIQHRRYSLQSNTDKEINNLFDLNNDNNFMLKLSNIINNKNLSKKERQFQIETIFFNIQSSEKSNFENIKKNIPHKLISIIFKIKETLNIKYEEKILKKKFPSFNDKLNRIELLYIAYSIVFTLISRKLDGWTFTSEMIGRNILKFLYNEEIKSKIKTFSLDNLDLAYKDYTKDKFMMEHNINDSNIYAIRLGDFFLELFSMEPHKIFERQAGYSEDIFLNKKSTFKVSIDPLIYEELSKNIIIESASIPMICKPNLWNESHRGGNLIEDFKDKDIITGNKNHSHSMNNKNILFDTVNFLNGMEFEINNDFLNYLKSENGRYLLKDIFNIKSSMESDSKPEYSTLMQLFTNIKLANIFKNETFFLPMRADFRGRLYVNSFYLNYQGSDLSRAFINMSKGYKLTTEGLDYLYIYGANLYNFDSLNKDTHNNRINWVKNNLNNIYNMELDFIKKAENVWLFISFCLVLKNIKDNQNYEVKFPIFIDATCSGIQHVAAMIKDLDTGNNVNLISQTPEDLVQDIYGKLLVNINKDITMEGNKPNSEYPNLKHVKLTRSDVKTPIMTKTYSVSLIGMKNQLSISLKNRIKDSNIVFENINKGSINIISCINNKLICLNYTDVFKIAQIIEKNIFSSYPLLGSIYNYFKNICKLLNQLGLPVIWSTPSGLEISQNYNKVKEYKISLSFAGKTKKLILKEWTNVLDKRAQINGLIPNVVHSLDASHLMEVLKECKKYNIEYILPIHDCFGTHPNNLEKVYNILKIEFINLYSKQNFLEKFQKDIIYVLKTNKFKIVKKKNLTYVVDHSNNKYYLMPELPTEGELDLNDIKNSRYMFN